MYRQDVDRSAMHGGKISGVEVFTAVIYLSHSVKEKVQDQTEEAIR